MKYKVIIIGLLLLISVNTCSANVFINGDFETGDLTGWYADSSYISTIAYKSNYSVKLYGFPASVSQEVNLKNVDYIDYYIKSTVDMHYTVKLDTEILVDEISESEDWQYKRFDVSNYPNTYNVIFTADDISQYEYMYIDNINSISSSPYNYFKNNVSSIDRSYFIVDVTLMIIMMLCLLFQTPLLILIYNKMR